VLNKIRYIICLELGKIVLCFEMEIFNNISYCIYILLVWYVVLPLIQDVLRRYTPQMNTVLFIKLPIEPFLLYVIIIPASYLPFFYVTECFSKTNSNDFPQEVNTWSFLWHSHLDFLTLHTSAYYLGFTPAEHFENRICLHSTQWPGTSVSVGG
jgi:hypothetical protein